MAHPATLDVRERSRWVMAGLVPATHPGTLRPSSMRIRNGARGLAAALGALLLWLALAASPAHADPAYPAFTGLVVDDAHILSEADKAELTRKLEALRAKTNVQFAVATVSSLGGDEIEPYANALFRQWKIGQKDVNNGLLLILAPKERKLRFEVGYGLEGRFTDLQSKLILRNAMVPRLKANDPAGALKAGVDNAIAVLTKDKAGLPGAPPETAPGDQAASTSANDTGGALIGALFLLIPLIIILIVVVVIIQTLRGKMQWTSTGSGWTSGTTSSSDSSWSSSDSSSSSSGDSFSGGGGGDSGGGGASDSY